MVYPQISKHPVPPLRSEGADHIGHYWHHPPTAPAVSSVRSGEPTSISRHNPQQFHGWNWTELLVETSGFGHVGSPLERELGSESVPNLTYRTQEDLASSLQRKVPACEGMIMSWPAEVKCTVLSLPRASSL